MEAQLMPVELQLDKSQPGLWVNRDWTPGTPGLYAVVIGVSKYDHLAGGSHPAQETYGLGQLAVSALTAFRVYQWLKEDYRVDNCPLAKCWVLLSPTEAELEHEQALADHATPATFDRCADALAYWQKELERLSATVAAESRSLFFFSGHGLEVHHEKQLLLTSDYLKPPAHNENMALSTQNIRFALASSPVCRQSYFFDACRNDHTKLRQKGIEGTKVLSERTAAEANANLRACGLYATSTGQRAWQQPRPVNGLSLFGQSLCQGLRGEPNILLECGESWCAVRIEALAIYIQAQVRERLARAGVQQAQPVRSLGGSIGEDITWVSRRARPSLEEMRRGDAGSVTLTGATALRQLKSADMMAMGTRLNAEDLPRVLTRSADWDAWRRLFGIDEMTDARNRRIRLYALGSHEELDPRQMLQHRVTLDRSRTGFRIELSIRSQDSLGFWLQSEDDAGTASAVVLPADQGREVRYLVECVVRGDPSTMTQLAASLADENGALLSCAHEMWRHYQVADLSGAVSEYNAGELRDVVRQKLDSPLAATVAALVLLRAGRGDLIGDWIENLATLFPRWPDGAVLRAEQLMRADPRDRANVGRAAQWLAELGVRGLPLTAECLSLAASLADLLLSMEHLVPQVADVRPLKEHLQMVMPFFQPNGLCTVLHGFPVDRQPWDLIGPFERRGQ
jgi:hypothetical protein